MKEKFIVTEITLGKDPYGESLSGIINVRIYSGKVHETYDEAKTEIDNIVFTGRSFQIQKTFTRS